MRYLSELTGDTKYWDKAKVAMGKILKAPKKDGLVPLFMEWAVFTPSILELLADPHPQSQIRTNHLLRHQTWLS